jgi:hypothetical protein
MIAESGRVEAEARRADLRLNALEEGLALW